MGNPGSPWPGTQACTLERSLQLRFGIDTTRGVAVTGYKVNSIGVENGRHGLPPTVGETSCFTGQLPPASSWVAPSQLGADPPDLLASLGGWS